MNGPSLARRDGLERGVRVAQGSRVAATAAALLGHCEAAARSSRAIAMGRCGTKVFHALATAERTRCLLIAAVAALVGHAMMARLLPTSASPTLSVTILTLIGAGLVAGISAQRGAGEEQILQPDHVARRPH